MTEQSQWLREQIEDLALRQSQFTDRAFWLALSRLVQEQGRRQEQLEGEIDGRTWRPDRW